MKNLIASIKKNWGYWAIIAALVIVICFLSMCRGNCPGSGSTTDTVTKTDTVTDSILITKEIPKPFSVHDTLIIPPGPIDTLTIVMAYFYESEYNVVLLDDTSAYIQYNFSVWMNQPLNGNLIFRNRRPTVINTTNVVNNIIQERKFKVFAGASIGGSLTSFELSPGVLFQYKYFLFGAQYNIFGESISIPIYYQFHFKKKGAKQ
jgi:hypothetical protein